MRIVLENVTHIYLKGDPREVKALKGINLTLQGSGVVGLIGRTGSGKSTLIQTMNGLLKPTSGSIFIDGEEITARGADLLQLRKRIGLVFQYPEHQLFEETVYQDLAFGPRNLGLEEKEVEARVHQALEAVELEIALLQRSPFELSGGQQRRVAIAGVLAMQPEVLILDEPTAGLDPAGREHILNQIIELQRERDLLVLLVSHRMEEVGTLAERLLVLEEGQLVLDGSPRSVFREVEYLRELDLDIPPLTDLFHRLANRGLSVSEEILTVEEARQEIMALLQGIRSRDKC